jgi:hypothetical protein
VLQLPLEPDDLVEHGGPALVDVHRAVLVLAQGYVDGGRSSLNFSDWTRSQNGAAGVADAISGRGMARSEYVFIHSQAGLSKAEQRALIEGLAATFRNSPPKGGGNR